LGAKQKKKREDESKKIEERFSSALSKTACTQGRVAAGEIQEAQKESFNTDILFYFWFFSFVSIAELPKIAMQCGKSGRRKQAREPAHQREREREREEHRETAAATVAAAAELCNLWRWRQRGSAVGLKDRAVCVIRPGYLSYTYGGATNGHTHTSEGAYII
jgi:hypothetical protein